MDVIPKTILKQIVWVAVVMSMASIAQGGSIRLADQAATHGPNITLAQIADLEGEAAKALGHTIVATLRPDQSHVAVSVEAIRRELEKEGVNWGQISLRGYAICEVQLTTPPPPSQTDFAEAIASNIRQEVTLTTLMTLRDLLLDRIETLTEVPRSQLRITFDKRSTEKLTRRVFGERYEVEPTTSRKLGRLVLKVHRYEMDEIAEQLTVVVTVEKRVFAVVATQTINRHRPFVHSAYEVREVYLNNDEAEPISDAKLLLGQTADRRLREGALIYPSDVRAPVIVKRGELIIVRCISGNLMIRVSAHATEDGARGQIIQVRKLNTRETYTVTVSGRREAVLRINETSKIEQAHS